MTVLIIHQQNQMTYTTNYINFVFFLIVLKTYNQKNVSVRERHSKPTEQFHPDLQIVLSR